MVSPTQFTFNLEELAKILIREAKIEDGSWVIGFEFGFAAANIGPSPEQSRPSAVLQINSVNISRQPSPEVDLPYAVRASEAYRKQKESD